MSEFNWRSPSDYYKRIEGAEMTGLAWECLRRNPEFQQDSRRAASGEIGAHPRFRQRWGLIFRS